MKILQKIKLSVVAAVMLLGIASCNSWLDVELANRVDEKELFSKPEGFQKALAGVYASMADSTLYGYQLSYGSLDILGQLYDYNALPSKFEYLKDLDYENKDVRSVIDAWWIRLYGAIEALNNILEWSEKNAGVMSVAELHQVRGEALGLRAYLFFDLVRLFAPDVKVNPEAQRIPYNTTFGVKLPPLYTTQNVIELILADLKQAEEYLANDPIVGTPVFEMKDSEAPYRNSADKYVARMNLYAVKAIMARVYLDKKDYTNARLKAKEVIESGCFSLLKRTELTTETKPENKDMLFSDEHIFSLRNKTIPVSAEISFVKTLNETQNVPLPVTGTYQSNYDDPSLDVRWMEWFVAGNGNPSMVKYFKHKDNAKNYFPKLPLIRLSELYMILSESYLEEDINKAKDYADILRLSRIGETGKLAAYSETDFIAEMRREFPGEGQLFFMYKRRNHDILRDGGVGRIPASEKAFVLLVPDSEVENGNVKQ